MRVVPVVMTISELVERALDDDRDAIEELYARGGDEVFAAANELLQSSSPKHRSCGADIIGQLKHPACGDVLLALLRDERDPTVLNSIGVGLGHLGDARAIEPLALLKNHEDEDVRFGVAFAMMGHEEPLAISVLIELSTDVDHDVRNWATFGLGHQNTVDTPELRQALRARLDEEDDEIRSEALSGLAVRGDMSVLEQLRRELMKPTVNTLFVEAAGALGDSSLLPLVKLLCGGDDYFGRVVADTISLLEK